MPNGESEILARLVGPKGPFALQWDDSMRPQFCSGPFTLGDIYERAGRSPEIPLLFVSGGVLSLGNVLHRAGEFAHVLKQRWNVGSGSRVALAMANSGDWVAAFVAITTIGGVAVLLEPDAGPMRDDILARSDCCLVILDRCGAMVSAGMGLPMLIADDLLAGGGKAPIQQERLKPSAEAVILFTSGSTGTPKGVVHTHASLLSGLKNMMLGAAFLAIRDKSGQRAASKGAPSTLVLSPFSNIAGLSQLLLAMVTRGSIVLSEGDDASQLGELVSQYQVRSIGGAAPDILRDILKVQPAKLASLSTFFLHGAGLQQRLVDDIVRATPLAAIATGYGMTETAGTVAVASLRDLEFRPNTSGVLLPTVDVRSLGAPTDGVGCEEIALRGPMLMKRYLSCDGAVADNDDWFATGDVGYVDTDGYLFVVDRLRDIVVSGDLSFSSAEVERCAAEEPAIIEAAVFPLSSPFAGETALAVVLDAAVTFDRRRLVEKLEAFFPGGAGLHVFSTARLPRTASGKVNRVELSKRAITEGFEGGGPQ